MVLMAVMVLAAEPQPRRDGETRTSLIGVRGRDNRYGSGRDRRGVDGGDRGRIVDCSPPPSPTENEPLAFSAADIAGHSSQINHQPLELRGIVGGRHQRLARPQLVDLRLERRAPL